MSLVIITCRSLLWTLLTITTTCVMVASVMSPQWLIGYERESKSIEIQELSNKTYLKTGEEFRPTIGIINRCTRPLQFRQLFKHDNCATYVTDFLMPNSQFPHAWKVSLVFFSAGCLLLVFTMGSSVVSICSQSMCGKSIFTVSGLIQSFAGLFCVIGLIVYPVGWSSEKVQIYCGTSAAAFSIDMCSLGWSFYLNIIGVALTFICSVLSIGAERATSSRKVESEVVEGKALICVLA